jgi:hypothetical protein
VPGIVVSKRVFSTVELALEDIEIARHEGMNDVTVLNRIIPEDTFITTIYQHIHDETSQSCDS